MHKLPILKQYGVGTHRFFCIFFLILLCFTCKAMDFFGSDFFNTVEINAEFSWIFLIYVHMHDSHIFGEQIERLLVATNKAL